MPHLSSLLGQRLLTPSGEHLGRIDDVVVRLRSGDHPVVTGLVVRIDGRPVFVPARRLSELGARRVELSGPEVDLRRFERRDGEVLVRADLLGHRLIDVDAAELVRAWDAELAPSGEGWLVSCLDTRRPARLWGLLRRGGGRACADWSSFEPLIGHDASRVTRGPFGRLRRLKPAQLADLLEEASGAEGSEILDAVHADPALEADVFGELDPDLATRLLVDRSDEEVAAVLARMRADDAVDAITELPQARRRPVIDLLPAATRARVLTLMGFSATSAGGLMGVEYLAGPPEATVEEGLRRVTLASAVQPEALVTLHAVDAVGRLCGTVSVPALLHQPPDALLADVVDPDPVRVGPDTDLVDVALLMADYNLVTLPVVGPDERMLGVITVDDVLEAVIPADWRRREPAPRPESPPDESEGGAGRA